jgi:thiol-disulfide isomerase/thioredoxin
MAPVALMALMTAVMALTAACAGGAGQSSSTTAPRFNTPGLTGTAPGAGDRDQSVEQVSFSRFDGSTGTLADYRGRPLVVNFFASWCAPCVREMTDFQQVHRELGDRVAFLGVNVRDRLEDGRSIVNQTGVTYDLARDPQGDLLQRLGGVAMPTTVLFNAEGKVVSSQSRSYDANGLRSTIEKKLLT